MTNKKIFFFINLLISLGLLTFLSFERYDILSDIWKFTETINKPLSRLSVNYLDVIILAFIPLWTMPFYLTYKTITLGRIILTNIITLLVLVLTCVICYSIGDVFADKPSPLLPDFPVYVPFQNYQTFALTMGCILTYTIFFIYLKRKQKLCGHVDVS